MLSDSKSPTGWSFGDERILWLRFCRFACQEAGRPPAALDILSPQPGAASLTSPTRQLPSDHKQGTAASSRSPMSTGCTPSIGASSLQVIGMSATLPNIQDVALWLNAQLFKTTWRPVDLQQRLIVGKQVGRAYCLRDSACTEVWWLLYSCLVFVL